MPAGLSLCHRSKSFPRWPQGPALPGNAFSFWTLGPQRSPHAPWGALPLFAVTDSCTSISFVSVSLRRPQGPRWQGLGSLLEPWPPPGAGARQGHSVISVSEASFPEKHRTAGLFLFVPRRGAAQGTITQEPRVPRCSLALLVWSRSPVGSLMRSPTPGAV